MTTPTPTPTTRRTFISRLLAAAGLAPLAAAAYSLPKPAQTQVIPCAQTEAYLKRVYAVKGAAVKVPSNRFHICTKIRGQGEINHRAVYGGKWNGTFALEAGCTNPAYILADLYLRTGAEPDWVVADKGVPACFVAGPMILNGLSQLLTPRLNWQMLYHFGQWADELSEDWTVMSRAPHGLHTEISGGVSERPRFTVNAVASTPEEMTELRETLRMHCLRWQSTDPRYRTSWPGVDYPEGRA